MNINEHHIPADNNWHSIPRPAVGSGILAGISPNTPAGCVTVWINPQYGGTALRARLVGTYQAFEGGMHIDTVIDAMGFPQHLVVAE